MDDKTEDSLECLVAESLDAEAELYDCLPELLADLDELSVPTEVVLDLIDHAEVAPGAQILDLGCGKGALAIGIGSRFGANVWGIDGHPKFVDAAVESARIAAQETCSFRTADIRQAVFDYRGLDRVWFVGIGPIIGDLEQTLATLRRCLRPGGYLVLDEAYLSAPKSELGPEYEHCFDRETTLARLESQGDRVCAEALLDTPASDQFYREATEKILARARAIAAEHPELASVVLEFADRQRAETESLGGPLVGALWLLRTPSDTNPRP